MSVDERKQIEDLPQKQAANKYGIKFRKNKAKKEVVEGDKEKKRSILTVGSFSFEECPTALFYNEKGLTRLIELVNWSEDMHTPLFGNGLDSYTNFYFECRQTIIGEQRSIENEEMKEQKDKGGKTGNKSKSRPRVAGRSPKKRR